MAPTVTAQHSAPASIHKSQHLFRSRGPNHCPTSVINVHSKNAQHRPSPAPHSTRALEQRPNQQTFPDSRAREVLGKVSLLGWWLSLLNQLIENIATNYPQHQRNMKCIYRLSAWQYLLPVLARVAELFSEAKSVPQQHILPAAP